MIRLLFSTLYDQLTWRRRRWYDRHPEARRRLRRPVVSVGNLAVGGTGKTPLVAFLAGLLRDEGERPAVISRGYKRRVRRDGVVVVHDGHALRARVEEAGDEPFMLARRLTGVAILVAEDRYLGGRFAEAQLGCTVHLLDDGFQHVALARDVDLLLVHPDDLEECRVLPAGRLRERLAAAGAADALVVPDVDPDRAQAVARQLGVGRGFSLVRTLGAPRLAASGEPAAPSWPRCRVLAVAGIARPDRFFGDLERAGVTIVGTRVFRDHHWFTARDLDDIWRAARARGADLVVTTEKDLVRFPVSGRSDPPVAAVPLTVHAEPEALFRSWLWDTVRAARAARESA